MCIQYPFKSLIISLISLFTAASFAQTSTFCPPLAPECGDTISSGDALCEQQCYEVHKEETVNRGYRPPEPYIMNSGEYMNLAEYLNSFTGMNVEGNRAHYENYSPESNGSTGDGVTDKDKSCLPVGYRSGNKIEVVVDYSTNDEVPLSFERSLIGTFPDHTKRVNGINYSIHEGMLGVGWTTNHENQLKLSRSGYAAKCYMQYDPNNVQSETCAGITADQVNGFTLYTNSLPTNFVYSLVDGVYDYRPAPNAAQPDVKLTRNSDNRWVIAYPNGYKEIYHANGLLYKTLNINGIGLIYSYLSSDSKRISAITHTSGKKLSLTWDENHLDTVITPEGNIISYSGDEYNDSRNSSKRRFLLREVSFSNSEENLAYDYKQVKTSPSVLGLESVYLGDIKYKEITYNGVKVQSSGLVGGVNQSSFTYSENRTTVTNAKGVDSIYQYNRSKLQKIERNSSDLESCPYAASEYEYSSTVLTSEKDWRGNIKSYTYYDAKGKKLKTEFSNNKSTKYVWDQYQRPKTITTWRGALPEVDCSTAFCEYSTTENAQPISKSTFNYNAANNRLSSIVIEDENGNQRTTSYSYQFYSNKLVKQKKINGPRTDVNDIVAYNYDSSGNLTSIVDPSGNAITYYYSGTKSLPYKAKDANGTYTYLYYDGKNRLTKKILKGSSGDLTTEFTINRFGKVSSVSMPGFSRNYSFDLAGRFSGWSDTSNNSAYTSRAEKISYDNLSNLVSRKITYGQSQFSHYEEASTRGGGTQQYPVYTVVGVDDYIDSWVYDDLGNLLSDRYGSYTYDKNLNLKTQTRSGKKTEFTYDSENRLKTSTNENNEAVEFDYDEAGRLSTVTDAKNNTTYYEFNGIEEIQQSSPDTDDTDIVLNEAGLPAEIYNDKGVKITRTYDASNRILSIYTSGTDSDYQSINFHYDNYSGSSGNCENGKTRLCAVVDNSGTTIYSYSKTGKLKKQTSVINGKTFHISYIFDEYDRLKEERYSESGIKTRYTYKTDSELGKVEVYTQGRWQTVVSHLKGPKYERFIFGNGLISNYYFNVNGHINEISNSKYRKKYSISRSGRVESEYLTTSDNGYTGWFDFLYDAQGRLTGTKIPYNGSQWNSLMNKYSETWKYDENGNRESYTKDGKTQTWQYESKSNRLISQGGHQTPGTYGYDAVGNITSTYQNMWKFKYDDLNRVREIDPPGMPAFTMKSNFSNHRVYRSVPYYKNGNWNSYDSHYYLFDISGKLVGESVAGKTSKRKHYIYFGNEIVGYVYNSALYYVHNDRLGRPEILTDFNDNVIWKVNNTSFGRNGYPTQTTNIDFNIGLPGQYWDSIAEMWYNWNRYYDQRTGRYIQSDPIGLQGGMNTYTYAINNPLSFIDPTGLDFAFSVDSQAAGGNGHTTLYFQDSSGNWFSYDQGTNGETSSGGQWGFLSGSSAPAGVNISPVSGPVSGSKRFKTTSAQDAKITASAYNSQKEHNSGNRKYNLYSNNCTDAAVDVINDSGVPVNIDNPFFTVRPNSWFQGL